MAAATSENGCPGGGGGDRGCCRPTPAWALSRANLGSTRDAFATRCRCRRDGSAPLAPVTPAGEESSLTVIMRHNQTMNRVRSPSSRMSRASASRDFLAKRNNCWASYPSLASPRAEKGRVWRTLWDCLTMRYYLRRWLAGYEDSNLGINPPISVFWPPSPTMTSLPSPPSIASFPSPLKKMSLNPAMVSSPPAQPVISLPAVPVNKLNSQP